MGSANFLIVTFVNEDDAPGIITSNWLIDSKTCYYPNVRTEEMKNKLLKRMAEPEVSLWPEYHIKVLKRYETYAEARLHLKKAEETSNLDSDEEVTRKRKRKIKNISFPEDSSSSDGDSFLNRTQPRQSLLKQRNDEYSNYPTPPKAKSVAKQNTITDPKTRPCCSDVEVYSYEEIEAEAVEHSSMPMEFDTVVNCRPENVPVDVNSAVNYPIISIPFSPNQANESVNCQSGCITSKQFAIQQSHLIQVVTDLSNQVSELNRKVDVLLGRSGEIPFAQTDENASISGILATLPVNDDASFDHFNEQLKISQNKQAVARCLGSIGGRNVRSMTTNILRRILLDEVAELYSLTGKQMKNSTKKSFLRTETCQLIFQISKKVYEDVTEEKVKEIISDWLNQAKVRISRRADRQQPKD